MKIESLFKQPGEGTDKTSGSLSFGKKHFWTRKATIKFAAYLLAFSIFAAVLFVSPGNLRGLPVDNFKIVDIFNQTIDFGPRPTDFITLFMSEMQSLVVVKVNSTESVKSDNSMFNTQISHVTVLQNLYGKTASIFLKIYQGDISNNNPKGRTNLLRKGGVYILPLSQRDDKVMIINDINTLLEVDDKGKVWSHSSLHDFNRFDGQDVTSLISKLQPFILNSKFLIKNKDFWRHLSYESMADITVNSRLTSQSYSFNINEVLSQPSDPNDNIKDACTYIVRIEDTVNNTLEEGKRYLVFLTNKGGTVYLRPENVAKIGADGTIKAVSATGDSGKTIKSTFSVYDGINISEMKDMIAMVTP